MHIKMFQGGSGFQLAAFSNDRRDRHPLCTVSDPRAPLMVPRAELVSLIGELKTEAVRCYAVKMGVQGYTSIAGGE